MKKRVWLVFVVLLSIPVLSDSTKKNNLSQLQLSKKQSRNRNKHADKSDTLTHLKRRYERGYSKQSHGDIFEKDVFGYMPN